MNARPRSRRGAIRPSPKDADRRVNGGVVAAAVLLLLIAGCADSAPRSRPVLSGQVLLPDGSPCSECHTGVTSPDYAMPELAQRTASDGSFEWTLPGGGVFTVEATGYGLRAHEVVSVGSDGASGVELRLE